MVHLQIIHASVSFRYLSHHTVTPYPTNQLRLNIHSVLKIRMNKREKKYLYTYTYIWEKAFTKHRKMIWTTANQSTLNTSDFWSDCGHLAKNVFEHSSLCSNKNNKNDTLILHVIFIKHAVCYLKGNKICSSYLFL